MVKVQLAEIPKRRMVRRGRPPQQLAGEVETRILDAARHVFLEHGLAGASMDEIAALARAGKQTIYARFAGKEALFAEVVRRNVATVTAQLEGHIPASGPIEHRLASVAMTVLHWALVGNTVDLMRVGIAEATRFPELAIRVHRMAHELATESVARLLRVAAQSDELGTLPAFAPERLPTTARFFLSLVFLPLVLRALYGEKLETLRAEIEPHVARAIPFFLAACRHLPAH